MLSITVTVIVTCPIDLLPLFSLRRSCPCRQVSHLQLRVHAKQGGGQSTRCHSVVIACTQTFSAFRNLFRKKLAGDMMILIGGGKGLINWNTAKPFIGGNHLGGTKSHHKSPQNQFYSNEKYLNWLGNSWIWQHRYWTFLIPFAFRAVYHTKKYPYVCFRCMLSTRLLCAHLTMQTCLLALFTAHILTCCSGISAGVTYNISNGSVPWSSSLPVSHAS